MMTTFLLSLARRFKQGGVIVNEHTLTRSQTSLHLDVLSRSFDFIRLEDLAGRLAGPRQRPFCLLTFDDGKRSNFTETAPELQRRNVPAVFYVTTDPLSDGSAFWFDRHRQLLGRLGYCPAGLELESLKRLPYDVLKERLDHFCASCGLRPECEHEDMQPMSWEEVRQLDHRGFTIGAHGLTHAILTCERKERALAEIEGSLAKVGSELGTPCRTFAFPNGNYSRELARHASRSGAETVMTTEPMWVDGHSASWRLPRIQLFPSFSPARIELKLALGAVKGLLTNPDGSGRAYRSRTKQNEAWEYAT